MIKNTLGFAALTLCLHSCSTDSLEQPINNNTIDNLARAAMTDPANTKNPYDLAGKTHDELLDLYQYNSTSTTPSGIILQVENIANGNNTFQLLSQGQYLPVTGSQQPLIINDDLQNILENLALSLYAKASLESFIDQLFSQDYPLQTYESLYTTIVTYEAGILSNSTITNYDKKLILTTTSIARYATARDKRKGKDKDWRLSRNNIIATAGGAAESEAKAVVVSIANGIYHSKLN